MTDHEYIKYAKEEFGVDVIFWGDDCNKTLSGRHILEDRKIDFWCSRCDTSFDRQIEFARRQKDGFGVFIQDSGDKIAYLQLGFAVEIEFYHDSPENGRKIKLRNATSLKIDRQLIVIKSDIHNLVTTKKIEFVKAFRASVETKRADEFLEEK